MQWCPLGALGGPSLPSASLQGDFRGTFPGWRNPSGSWIEMQVGVVAKEPKAPQAHVFSLICQVNLSCVWMGGVYLSWVRSLSSRNGLSCRTRGSRSHSRYSSRCPQSGGPGSGLLAPGHMTTVSLQSPLGFTLPKDKDYLTFLKNVVSSSQVVLVSKNPSANAEDVRDPGSISGLVRCPGGGHGNPLIFLPGENHEQRSLGGLQSIESQRVRHN